MNSPKHNNTQQEYPLTKRQKELVHQFSNTYLIFAQFLDFFYKDSFQNWNKAFTRIFDIAYHGEKSLYFSRFSDEYILSRDIREVSSELKDLHETMCAGRFGFIDRENFMRLAHVKKIEVETREDQVYKLQKMYKAVLFTLLACIRDNKSSAKAPALSHPRGLCETLEKEFQKQLQDTIKETKETKADEEVYFVQIKTVLEKIFLNLGI